MHNFYPVVMQPSIFVKLIRLKKLPFIEDKATFIFAYILEKVSQKQNKRESLGVSLLSAL